jgi:hypothetical protein
MKGRLVIAGGPKAGKSTLAKKLGGVVRSTDSVRELGWSEASAEVAAWFDDEGDWTIEGVAAPRALRKWLSSHPKGRPCDRVLYISGAHEALSPGQAAMSAGVRTVWEEILPELKRRGVEVVTDPLHIDILGGV